MLAVVRSVPKSQPSSATRMPVPASSQSSDVHTCHLSPQTNVLRACPGFRDQNP